ncbi:hypothetical protein EVB32_231 [Rhizobium phage RHph_TM39]|uniref:Uncharacterized protein n=2 Tax=Cuauhnahuacvirus TaxID=3044696 RepID=A0A7S5RDM6_9CAUD|nr:hypothetical protein PQC16_gp247 [Rhizobium phage RHph_TM30]YP_010671396.1 hypothetical protein PQC17_gp247 [Rhizobium phage RHph_Y65]QIG71718.1 hypothetical protein EVB94_247 [Rhizobium phage RHph_TM40]QIG72081.1 hypothetical protein EVB95_247 [Rhizobium phage RHph_TM2_3B]QIG72443.1 hypothetical protein EVB96_247 [Rhizobium phage RHph_TM3_3_6]QIG77219.1 hypothetical protein EVB32_231 [Rhizobium phage RHph_TM39]QIG77525.1 hypothetical protein EVB61_198 [Rhizobium phage RHph_TM21B]QIG77833
MAHACILLIGKYKKSLVNYLDQDPIYYSQVEEGTEVIAHYFNVHNVIDVQRLGELVGIDDYKDMSQSVINKARIDHEELEEFGSPAKVNGFIKLLDNGFKPYFEVSF